MPYKYSVQCVHISINILLLVLFLVLLLDALSHELFHLPVLLRLLQLESQLLLKFGVLTDGAANLVDKAHLELLE